MSYLWLIPAALALYAAGYVFYQLYLHPLAKVPGPKLAAITRLYEFYRDCIQPGQYCFEIMELHKKYGDIVRIGPNEVHLTDPVWFDTLYNPNAKLDKDPWFYGLLGNHQSAFATIEYDVHRMKRTKANPFFSKANVDRSGPLLKKVAQNLFAQFDTKKANGEVVGLKNAFRSYAADIACEFCFPRSMEFVKAPEFSPVFHKGQEEFARFFPWMRHVPGLATMLMNTPDFVIPYMAEDAQAALGFVKFIEQQVKEVMDDKEKINDTEQPTIIRTLLESDLPASDRTAWALEEEAKSFVAAGTATTARALENTIYFILSTPEVAQKLTEEVRAFKPDAEGLLSSRELEQLPYLSACVLECLRIVPAVPGRFPRTNKTETMVYKNYALPSGTVIGMSPWDILLDERVFPDPWKFKPERWIDPAVRSKNQKYFVPFGRGSRSCIGQNLAMAEIYLVLGNIFRKYDMSLYETGERDVTIAHDYFVPAVATDSPGVRIVFK